MRKIIAATVLAAALAGCRASADPVPQAPRVTTTRAAPSPSTTVETSPEPEPSASVGVRVRPGGFCRNGNVGTYRGKPYACIARHWRAA
jgi:hypothetical protein